MVKFIYSLSSLLLTFLVSISCHGSFLIDEGYPKVYYIDFGNSSYKTPGNWNNFSEYQSALPSKILIDSLGDNTPLVFTVVSNAGEAYDPSGINAGGYNGSFGEFPASACRDSYFSFGSGGYYKIQNANPDRFYTIVIFGSRNVSDNKRIAAYTIFDEIKYLDCASNTSKTATFFNVKPDSNHEIPIHFGVAPDSEFGYINAIKIIEMIEPAIDSPTDFSAVMLGRTVHLTWNDMSNNENGFIIERKAEDEENFYEVAAVPANSISYIDTTFRFGYQYRYRIYAMNNEGRSLSNETLISVPVDPFPPSVRRFLIDLGEESLITGGNNWNNVYGPQDALPSVFLNDDKGNKTNLKFEVLSDASNGYANNGGGFNSYGFNQEILSYPATAVRDCYFSWEMGGVYQFSGLDPSKFYDIVILGSRTGAAEDRVGTYKINSFVQSLDASSNTSEVVKFYKETPTVEGIIELKFGVAEGSEFGYINVIELKETAVPAIVKPEGLRLLHNSYDQIKLAWTAIEPSGNTSFEIYRSDKNNLNYEIVGYSSTNQFTDSGIAANSLYYYRIKTVYKNGSGVVLDKSPYSAEISVNTPSNPNLRTYKINFTQHEQAPFPWNNSNIAPENNNSFSNIIDDQGNTSTISITFLNSWDGSNNVGMITGDESGIFPDAALKTAYWCSANKRTILVSGLKENKYYNFTFFGSRDGSRNRTTNYKIGNQVVSLNAANNTRNVVTIKNIFADSEGKVLIDVEKSPNSQYGYINALIIEEWDNNGPPDKPILVSATPSNEGIILEWQGGSSNESGFEIYKSIGDNQFFELLNLSLPRSSKYIDHDAKPNTSYFYKIRAINRFGNSDFVDVGPIDLDGFKVVKNVLVNFGLGSESLESWNTVDSTGYLSNLLDEYSLPTGISIETIQPFDGVNELGMNTGDNSGIFPDIVMKTAHWVQNNTASIKVCGLQNDETYNFRFFGSRNGGGNRNTIYSIANKSVVLNASYNVSNSVLIEEIVPDVFGCVTITIKKEPTSLYGYLNAMLIEVPSEIVLDAPDQIAILRHSTSNNLILSWRDNSNNEDIYEIYKSLDNVSFDFAGSVPSNQRVFTDSASTSDYYYKVRARSANQYSKFSNTVFSGNIEFNPHNVISDASGLYFATALNSNLNSRCIVILGSSTSEGHGASSIANSYAGLLENHLFEKYFYRVINLAKGGFKSQDILPSGDPERNINRALSFNPTAIIINLPANDLASGVPDYIFFDNLRTVKNIANENQVKVFITTTQPRNFANLTQRQKLKVQADSIMSIFGNDAINVFDILGDSDLNIKSEFNKDNTHVNDLGHHQIFNRVLYAIEPYIRSTIIQVYINNLPEQYQLVNNYSAKIELYSSSNIETDDLLMRSVNLNGQQYTRSITINRGRRFYSINSGLWSDPNVWSLSFSGPPANEVPTIDDSVIINGHHITIHSNSFAHDIYISNSNASSLLTISNGKLTVKSQIKIEKVTESYSTALQVVDSGSLKIE